MLSDELGEVGEGLFLEVWGRVRLGVGVGMDSEPTLFPETSATSD